MEPKPSAIICIYPPHFFSRYRERARIQGPESGLDLIHHFIKHQWTVSLMMFREMDNEEIAKQVGKDAIPEAGSVTPYKGLIDWDGILETEDINMVMRDARGFILGARQEDTIICKTFVADDMVFEDQFPLFRSVNYLFYKHIYEQFGPDGYRDILRYEDMPPHPLNQFISDNPDQPLQPDQE